MAAITASMVAELYAKTDAPVTECKKALTEAEGNPGKAEEILRVKLGSRTGKAASRITAEGVVTVAMESTTGALVEINCETDFVSENDSFLTFVNSVAALIAKSDPTNVAAVDALPLSRDDFGPTVEDVRMGLIDEIGKGVTIRRFQRSESAQLISYLRGARTDVMVAFEGSEVAAKDAAMQATAVKPVSLSADDMPAELVTKERSVAEQKATESGKPAGIIAEMVKDSVQKYLKEVSLLNQPSAKNGKQTVKQMLKAVNTTVGTFTLYVVGKGIKKKQDDFAAEVAAQMAVAKQQT